MGAKVGLRAGLQTYDMFTSTWFVNYDMFASGSTRIVRLVNIWYFESTWLAKISYVCKPCKIIPFLFIGIGPLYCVQIGIHMIQFGWSLRGFAQSAATLLLKNKHYITPSIIFPSPGDVSITAIAAFTAKRWTHPPACQRPQLHASLSSRSKMPLPPPLLQLLLFGHRHPSPLANAPFSSRCQPLSSHSHHCQPLLAITNPIDGWLLRPSLLPSPLSAACSIVLHSHHWHFCLQPPCCPLFDLCCSLFDCPPSFFNGGHPFCHCFKPCTLSCPSCSLV